MHTKHLHSTIFILIPKPRILNQVLRYYLHSTIFILIPGRFSSSNPKSKYLHSTIFILILQSDEK